jgi:hypothetical protein
MARPCIEGTFKKLSESLTICECHRDFERPQGFWIYDKIAGRNLAMGNPDRDAAFVEAIEYYQKRLQSTTEVLNDLQHRVDTFVAQFIDSNECEGEN